MLKISCPTVFCFVLQTIFCPPRYDLQQIIKRHTKSCMCTYGLYTHIFKGGGCVGGERLKHAPSHTKTPTEVSQDTTAVIQDTTPATQDTQQQSHETQTQVSQDATAATQDTQTEVSKTQQRSHETQNSSDTRHK